MRDGAALSRLDVLAVSPEGAERGYIRPKMWPSGARVEDGRHPVLESDPRTQPSFQPRRMDTPNAKCCSHGPNMAQSTYLRQNALLVVLSQPRRLRSAKRARIGVTTASSAAGGGGQPAPRPLHLHDGDDRDGGHLEERTNRSSSFWTR